MRPYEILAQFSRYFFEHPELFDSRGNWLLSSRTMAATEIRLQRRDPEGREKLNRGVTL